LKPGAFKLWGNCAFNLYSPTAELGLPLDDFLLPAEEREGDARLVAAQVDFAKAKA
jgi:hypothetical protein